MWFTCLFVELLALIHFSLIFAENIRMCTHIRRSIRLRIKIILTFVRLFFTGSFIQSFAKLSCFLYVTFTFFMCANIWLFRRWLIKSKFAIATTVESSYFTLKFFQRISDRISGHTYVSLYFLEIKRHILRVFSLF